MNTERVTLLIHDRIGLPSWGLAGLAFGIVACAHQPAHRSPVFPKCGVESPSQLTALDAAPKIIERAVAGRPGRSEIDEMLRIEAKVPGFGGFHPGDASDIVALMKKTSTVPDSVVRQTLHRAYATRPEAAVRLIMAPAAYATIERVDYSLSELMAIKERIEYGPVEVPGFSGVGVSIIRNRVILAFVDSASVCAGMAEVARRGVPLEAVVPEVWGRARGSNDIGKPRSIQLSGASNSNPSSDVSRAKPEHK